MTASATGVALSAGGLRLRPVGWCGVVAAAGLAGLGAGAGSRPLLLAGTAGAVALAALLAPELILALLLVAGPLKGAPWMPALPGDLTVMAAVGVALAIVVRYARPGAPVPTLPAAASLMVAFTALILASALWAPDPGEALDKAMRFELLTFLAFLAPLLLLRSRAELYRVMVVLVAVGMLLSLTAVSTGEVAKPLVAAGGNEIDLGLYASLGLVAAAGYLVSFGPRPWRYLWLVPAVLLAGTVLAAGSRGALVGSGLALAFVWGRQLVAGRARRALLIGAAAAAVAALVVVGGDVSGQAGDKYDAGLFSSSPDQVLGPRVYLAQRGWELALDHPLGLGAGGYTTVTGEVYPHNILLELGAEQGVLAVGLLLAVVVAAWRRRLLARDGPAGPEAILAAGLILLLGVESLVSFGLNENRLLFFALGLAMALPRLRTGARGAPW